MRCAAFDNCIGCSLTDHCLIYKEWQNLTGIGFKENRLSELINITKNILGLINIVKSVTFKDKQNIEQMRNRIDKLQNKLSELL